MRERAFYPRPSEPLRDLLRDEIAPEDPGHVAEFFRTIDAHIDRREIPGDWPSSQAAGFAATALGMLDPMLRDPRALDPLVNDLKRKAVVTWMLFSFSR